MKANASVVVCTYNRADMLDPALGSLREQQTFGKVDFEIVVVDDGSIDQTERVVLAQRNAASVPIRYVRQERSGIAAARNRGVRESNGDWIAFFDDDQIAETNWLARLVEKAGIEDADYVGGPYLLRLPENCGFELDSTLRRLLGENPLMQHERNVSYSGLDPRKHEVSPGTGNVLVKRAIFERIGLFSEGRHYGEDREFFRRAQKAGARFAIAPSAVVYHVVPASRLTKSYLLGTAAKGGRSQAEIDDYQAVLWRALLRLGYTLIVTLPKLGYALLLRNHSAILARRCSLRFSLQYIAVALQRSLGMQRKILSDDLHPEVSAN